MPQQPEADWPGPSKLSRRRRGLPDELRCLFAVQGRVHRHVAGLGLVDDDLATNGTASGSSTSTNFAAGGPSRPPNSTVARSRISTYLCPSDPITRSDPYAVTNASNTTLATMSPTSYAACVGNDLTDSSTGLNNDGIGNGVMYRNSSIRIAGIIDGTSQTVMVGERAWSINSGTWVGVVSSAGWIRRGRGLANPCPTSSAADDIWRRPWCRPTATS